MKIHDVKSSALDNDIIWFGKDDIYVIEKTSRCQKSKSKMVMMELKEYIKENKEKLPYNHIIVQHKMRYEYMKFRGGVLYIQAHLKRNMIGNPKYWQMEFYFEGNMYELSYEEYLNVKITKNMGFRFIYEMGKTATDLYEQLHNGMAILAEEFMEYRTNNISILRERYREKYEKLIKKRKCSIIRINEE